MRHRRNGLKLAMSWRALRCIGFRPFDLTAAPMSRPYWESGSKALCTSARDKANEKRRTSQPTVIVSLRRGPGGRSRPHRRLGRGAVAGRDPVACPGRHRFAALAARDEAAEYDGDHRVDGGRSLPMALVSAARHRDGLPGAERAPEYLSAVAPSAISPTRAGRRP